MPQAVAPQAIQAQALVPYQELTTVPIQGQAVVATQRHMAVPITGQAMGVQPHGMIVQHGIAAQGAVVAPQGVNAQMQGINLKQAEDFCEMVRQLREKMGPGN
jgi:hypothetical protein